MSKGNRKGHKLLGFITRIAEHHTLIACTCVKFIVISAFKSVVNAHSYIGALLVKGREDSAGLVVKAVVAVIVACFLYDISCYCRNVNVCCCRDLAHYQNHTCCGAGFAGYTGVLVLC